MANTNQAPEPLTANTEHSPIDWHYAYDLFRTGRYSIRQIAAEVGCDESAVRKRITSHKWKAHHETALPEGHPNVTHKADRLGVRDRHRRLLEEGATRLQRLGRRLDKQIDTNQNMTPEQIDLLVMTQWRWSRSLAILIGLEREVYALEADSALVERHYVHEKMSAWRKEKAQISGETPQVQTAPAQAQNQPVRTADQRGPLTGQGIDETMKELDEGLKQAEQLLAQMRS